MGFRDAQFKTAIRLNNLARLLAETDRMKEAEPLLQEALKIFEKYHMTVARFSTFSVLILTPDLKRFAMIRM